MLWVRTHRNGCFSRSIITKKKSLISLIVESNVNVSKPVGWSQAMKSPCTIWLGNMKLFQFQLQSCLYCNHFCSYWKVLLKLHETERVIGSPHSWITYMADYVLFLRLWTLLGKEYQINIIILYIHCWHIEPRNLHGFPRTLSWNMFFQMRLSCFRHTTTTPEYFVVPITPKEMSLTGIFFFFFN